MTEKTKNTVDEKLQLNKDQLQPLFERYCALAFCLAQITTKHPTKKIENIGSTYESLVSYANDINVSSDRRSKLEAELRSKINTSQKQLIKAMPRGSIDARRINSLGLKNISADINGLTMSSIKSACRSKIEVNTKPETSGEFIAAVKVLLEGNEELQQCLARHLALSKQLTMKDLVSQRLLESCSKPQAIDLTVIDNSRGRDKTFFGEDFEHAKIISKVNLPDNSRESIDAVKEYRNEYLAIGYSDVGTEMILHNYYQYGFIPHVIGTLQGIAAAKAGDNITGRHPAEYQGKQVFAEVVPSTGLEEKPRCILCKPADEHGNVEIEYYIPFATNYYSTRAGANPIHTDRCSMVVSCKLQINDGKIYIVSADYKIDDNSESKVVKRLYGENVQVTDNDLQQLHPFSPARLTRDRYLAKKKLPLSETPLYTKIGYLSESEKIDLQLNRRLINRLQQKKENPNHAPKVKEILQKVDDISVFSMVSFHDWVRYAETNLELNEYLLKNTEFKNAWDNSKQALIKEIERKVVSYVNSSAVKEDFQNKFELKLGVQAIALKPTDGGLKKTMRKLKTGTPSLLRSVGRRLSGKSSKSGISGDDLADLILVLQNDPRSISRILSSKKLVKRLSDDNIRTILADRNDSLLGVNYCLEFNKRVVKIRTSDGASYEMSEKSNTVVPSVPEGLSKGVSHRGDAPVPMPGMVAAEVQEGNELEVKQQEEAVEKPELSEDNEVNADVGDSTKDIMSRIKRSGSASSVNSDNSDNSEKSKAENVDSFGSPLPKLPKGMPLNIASLQQPSNKGSGTSQSFWSKVSEADKPKYRGIDVSDENPAEEVTLGS